MTEPQVIWRRLTVNFARSVSFPDQTPAVMQVLVYPLAQPSSSAAGATFVSPHGTQEVVLAHPNNPVTFELIPSHLAGLSEELIYRIQWRAGVTGRTYTFDFAMPDQDINFEDLADLGKIIDGEAYLRQADLGIAGRVARLNSEGHVVDAFGQQMATVGTVGTVADQIAAERVARAQGDAAVAAAAQEALETQITSVLNTTAANLTGAVSALNTALNTERTARVNNDTALGARIDGVLADISDVEATINLLEDELGTKAPVVDGRIPVELIPEAARTTGVQVPSMEAMLELTSEQVQRFDFAFGPHGVWALFFGDDPSDINNWVQLNKVLSVNGEEGHVVLDLSDIAAAGGQIDIGHVQGLQHALDNAGDAEAIDQLDTRVAAIETDATIVRTVDGVIDHTLNDEHMVYLSADGKIVDKAGNELTVPGTGSVNLVNGQDGIVVLDLDDVAAEGGSIAVSQVDGLPALLDGKVDDTDERLSDARTPLWHAASHAADGDDPLTLASSQVDGLDTTLFDHEARIAELETHGGGGGGGGGEIAKANWFQGLTGLPEVTDPADFQTEHSVSLRGPFARTADGDYVYNADGVAGPGQTYVWAYITPNGHLQLRQWDESAPPDPEPATADDIDALSTALAAKAEASDLSTLSATVADKADQSAHDALAGIVADKADQSDLDDLADEVDDKADAADVAALSAQVATKAAQSDMATALADIEALQEGKADLDGDGRVVLSQLPDYPLDRVSGLQAALEAKADLTGGGTLHPDQVPANIPTAKIDGLDATLAAKADLVNGTIPSSQLPPLATTEVHVVPNRAALLALTPDQAQRGDLGFITATADKGNYVLANSDPSVWSNWVRFEGTEGTVSSVNGQTGTVVLSAADVGARSLGDPLAISDTAGLQAALDSKASTAALNSGLAARTTPDDVRAALSASTPLKQRVARVATTAVASLSGAQSVDGALAPPGTLVLLTAQPSSVQNGIWMVQSGAWTRPPDYTNGAYLLRGTVVAVSDGTTNAHTLWQMTSNSGVIGIAPSMWVRIGHVAPPFAPVAGNGVEISGTTFRVHPAPSGGVTVSAAGVAVDNTVVRKVTGFVPAGNPTAVLTHNLGTNTPLVTIYEHASNNLVLAGVTTVGLNAVAVEFATAPIVSQYRYMIVG